MTAESTPSRDRDADSQKGCGLGPGDQLDGRFQIHRFVGQGAYAEVFKANDGRYSRTVALKVPFGGIGPGGELWRLVQEVKAAQAVSHPNVMQAWEVGSFETPGGKRHYIVSRWIEGDTMRSVLDRSLGSLTEAEKIHFAHDLCAGLQAIHRERILHRDIKPSNVMLTPDGRAVITDFGLATLAGAATNPRAGAEGFKAPELDRGHEPTEQSDLYSLGMVLLELFLGSRPSAEELEAGDVQLPDLVGGERLREVLRRCIDERPSHRPRSAADVAEALPPRPSSDQDSTRCVPVETLLIDPDPVIPREKFSWLFAAGLLVLAWIVVVGGLNPLFFEDVIHGKPPMVLEYEARDIVGELGFGRAPADRLTGYEVWRETPTSAATLPRAAFWYRQSPMPLVAGRSGSVFLRYGDPPFQTAGEVGVMLDTEGRLIRLDSLPMAGSAAGSQPQSSDESPDWDRLLALAGLDRDHLQTVEPEAGVGFSDRRMAWEGSDPESGRRVRVEASFQGPNPVHFRVAELESESDPASATPSRRPISLATGEEADLVLFLYWAWMGFVLVGAIWLCLRNLRLRHADLLGATRLAVFVVGIRCLVWLLGGHHTLSPGALEVLQTQLERGLHDGLRAWILYVAVEPFARRRWAWQVASWVRLLRGRFADRLVGRDLLVGTLFGLGLTFCGQLYAVAPGVLGLPEPEGYRVAGMAGLFDDGALARHCQAVLGLRESTAMALYAVMDSLMLAFFATVGVVFLRWLMRSAFWSRPAAVLIFSILFYPSAGHPVADAVVVVLITSLWLTALVRYGFLAAVVAMAVAWWLNSHPTTLDVDAWFATGAIVPVALVFGVLTWGYRAAVGTEGVWPRWFDRVLEEASDPAITDRT